MSTKTEGPRERLLAAAQDLFYARGVGVGVDAILGEADVARRSLYEHFGGKDGLIVAVLRRAAEEDLAWYDAALGDGAEPRDRLLGLFDRLDELTSSADFRGCRYFATDLALAEPERAAERLHLLIEGALVMGATQDGQHPALAARDLAAVVLG